MKKMLVLLVAIAFFAIGTSAAEARGPLGRGNNVAINNGVGGASVVSQQFGLFGRLRNQTIINNGVGSIGLQRGIVAPNRAILVSPSNSIFLGQPRFIQLSDGSLILVR